MLRDGPGLLGAILWTGLGRAAPRTVHGAGSSRPLGRSSHSQSYVNRFWSTPSNRE